MEKRKQSQLSEKDLIDQDVYFNGIKISAKKMFHDKLTEDGIGSGFYTDKTDISVQWKIVAIKKDNKGIVVGCVIKAEDLMYVCKLEIEVIMEFIRSFKEEFIFQTSFFQVLAAKLFFPHLVNIVLSNTSRMDSNISPLILDNDLLNLIINETEKQGPFKKMS